MRLAPLDPAPGGRQHCAVRAESPLQYCEYVVNLGHWRIDGPGEYALELLYNDISLVCRRLSVREFTPRSPG